MKVVFVLLLLFSVPGAPENQVEIWGSPDESYETFGECLAIAKEVRKLLYRPDGTFLGSLCIGQSK